MRNVPCVFNFKVNGKYLNKGDFDLIYTAERYNDNNHLIHFMLDGEYDCKLYATKEVSKYINDGSWLIESIDYLPTEVELEDCEKGVSTMNFEKIYIYNKDFELLTTKLIGENVSAGDILHQIDLIKKVYGNNVNVRFTPCE